MSEFDYVQGQGWRPKPGDICEGLVIDIGRGYSTESEDWYPILTVLQADGTVTMLHCFHTVLKEWVLTNKPQVNSTVGIKFLGKKKKKGDSKQEVADYICRIKGDAARDPYAGMVSGHGGRQARDAAPDPPDELPF